MVAAAHCTQGAHGDGNTQTWGAGGLRDAPDFDANVGAIWRPKAFESPRARHFPQENRSILGQPFASLGGDCAENSLESVSARKCRDPVEAALPAAPMGLERLGVRQVILDQGDACAGRLLELHQYARVTGAPSGVRRSNRASQPPLAHWKAAVTQAENRSFQPRALELIGFSSDGSLPLRRSRATWEDDRR